MKNRMVFGKPKSTRVQKQLFWAEGIKGRSLCAFCLVGVYFDESFIKNYAITAVDSYILAWITVNGRFYA